MTDAIKRKVDAILGADAAKYWGDREKIKIPRSDPELIKAAFYPDRDDTSVLKATKRRV